MTNEDRLKCLVWIGDAMPDGELPDMGDKPRLLSGLRGQKLTVICLWRSGETEAGRLKALEILGDLQDLYETYLPNGVHVVGINQRDPPEVFRASVAEARAMFPNLSDPDGAYLQKVATEGLPRVYLLDAEGKILWLDSEFSLTTGRNLKTGIQVALGEI